MHVAVYNAVLTKHPLSQVELATGTLDSDAKLRSTLLPVVGRQIRNMDSREGVLDATLVPLGLLILLAYQVFWFWRVRNAPLRTVLGVNHLARRYWVESIMKVRPFSEYQFLLPHHSFSNNTMLNSQLSFASDRQ